MTGSSNRSLPTVMERRTFLAMVPGSLFVAPLATEAQPAGKVYQVGILSYIALDELQGSLATLLCALTAAALSGPLPAEAEEK
jgi:hypothetical protein